MKIHRTLEQKSWDWFLARAGKVTGSELGNLITDKGTIRGWKTAMPNSYLHRKLAEKWRGAPLEAFAGNRQTDQGNIYEKMARDYFSALLESDVQQVGGIESDDGRLWVSPDGIIGESVGLEIKCPNADTHVGWLLDGPQVPEEHVLQVQFALFVTGWRSWQFLSYCKDMPHLAVEVSPDDELQQTIDDAVHEFHEQFNAAWFKLCELNGGPPPEREKPEPPRGFGAQHFESATAGSGYVFDENEVPIP
jgi:predicted phage-related endonuclease